MYEEDFMNNILDWKEYSRSARNAAAAVSYTHLTPDRCPFTRICGCYVDGEKNKKMNMKESWLSLSDEEMFK